ncbi:MAG: glycosyltransferase, partial [Selenomonas sp.]
MKIIVSGGGTGGHIYPALTLVSVLAKKERTAEFLYVGTQKGLEADIIPKEGIPFETVDIEGLKRSFSPTNIVRLGRAMHGLAEAAAIVRRFRPDVAIGTGGYVCGPILMAASLAHVPTLIQEQNVVPGVTNKILSKFVTKIAVGTEEALCRFPRKKAVFTGNPIRREVMTASREKALEKFGFDAAKRTVLVSGGSRGARSIDRAMVGVLQAAQEYPEVQFLLVTGRGEYEDVMRRLEEAGMDLAAAPHIKVEPYLYNMPEAMAMADLAVFRAGATGLAELTARGVP